MAEGRHVSQAELEEMERRKRKAAEIGEDHSQPLTGEHEQESDRRRADEETRIVDPVITSNPD